jgi:hypothetical protein
VKKKCVNEWKTVEGGDFINLESPPHRGRLIGSIFFNFSSFFQGRVPYFKIIFLDFEIRGGGDRRYGFLATNLTASTTPSDFVRTPLLEKSRAVKFWNLKPFSSKEKVGPPMRLG